MSNRVEVLRGASPDAPSHEVGVNDIFFSVTDAKGVITHVNDVFMHHAQYSADELIGQPHNLIRNPEMPAGAFKLMWDTIGAGRPFAAYVRNQAKNGSAYDVFATVTPLPDGSYLSVRTRPMTQLFNAAGDVYQAANEVEHSDEGQALGRRERAEQGVAKLAELIPDYDAFIRDALPAEVIAREEAGFALPEGEGETYQAAVALYHELDEFMASLTAISEAVDGLRKANTTLIEESSVTDTVRAEMENVNADEATLTLLLAPLQVWSTMRGVLDQNAQALAATAEELHLKTSIARMAIALARLHTAQTAQFAAESGTEAHSAESASANSMRLLIDALQADVREMDAAVFAHSSLHKRVEMKVNSIAELTKLPLDMLGSWSETTGSSDMGEELAPLAAKIDEAMKAAEASVEGLQQAVAKLAQAPSADGVREALTRLDASVN